MECTYIVILQAQREEAEQMFSEALQKAASCSENRFSQAVELLSKLSDNADKLRTFANQAFEELRNCSEQQSNFIATAACIGNVGLQSDLKGATLLAQSGLLVSFNQVSIYISSSSSCAIF